MDEFYGMDISEEEQIKIMNIKEAMPENIRDVILIKDIQNLLKINIDELETQITILLSNHKLNFTEPIKPKCEAVKKIIYPEQTTNINNNKKKTIQTDQIFSDKAVKGITKYLASESQNNGIEIDFTNGVISDEDNHLNTEILNNYKSRFSFTQINYMLINGVEPDCLLPIKNFDIYIKYQYLANDMMNADISKSLCEQFIDFLYRDINKGHLDKQDTNNRVTPAFVQNFIIKYISDKKSNEITEIKTDPVIFRLFFDKSGILRDKKEINELLGNDGQILEIFMNANVDPMLLNNIINLSIKWDFSDVWLNKIKSNNSYDDYNVFLDHLITTKKLQTFTLADLLEDKNQILGSVHIK